MKVLLAIIAVLFYTSAFAAVDAAISLDGLCQSVSSSTNLVECTYTITDDITADNTTQFSLETESTYGNIEEFIISNDSVDFDFWFSKDVDLTATDVDTFIYYTAKNLSFSPDFNKARNWINRNVANLLYLTITNNAGTITNTYLSITFGK